MENSENSSVKASHIRSRSRSKNAPFENHSRRSWSAGGPYRESSPFRRCRTPRMTLDANLNTRSKSTSRKSTRNKKKQRRQLLRRQNFKKSTSDDKGVYTGEPKWLQEGEVFSPLLWKKFHIDDHLFDIPSGKDVAKQEVDENMSRMKVKYPHLTKTIAVRGETGHREKILSGGYHPRSRVEVSEINMQQKSLWQRHVDMMKSSKSTSYYNFLSQYDRQSCRACSHSKTCSSNHCSSCDSAKCEKHAIDIDFLSYIPSKGSAESDETHPKTHAAKRKVKSASTIQRPSFEKLRREHRGDVASSIASDRYTMQGFTITRTSSGVERHSLLSGHIEGHNPATRRSSEKKCLACVFAKENVTNKTRQSSDDNCGDMLGFRTRHMRGIHGYNTRSSTVV